ncbi:hypothetical protein POM88_027799 [Heracleum sosnowskyi]|uniref:Uncharacterized protein n=1 Tax=Heracleum sosnowskyi TaxID=360622 RepID=A0AAD8IBQ4_9APIA|nr:hypothetical protein POM88_027799 [Heracleum sosnowskyi]
MGRKIDALLGRMFKTYKFKHVVSLPISRLSVLEKQQKARMSVTSLISLSYLTLVIMNVLSIGLSKGCPEELKEAVSSLIYAFTRRGEFPELQEMHAMFTSRFGKEFVARGVELHNNCKFNTKMVVKLSTRQPDLESGI